MLAALAQSVLCTSSCAACALDAQPRQVVVGRAKEADVQLDSSKASRRHLRVFVSAGTGPGGRQAISAEDKSRRASHGGQYRIGL